MKRWYANEYDCADKMLRKGINKGKTATRRIYREAEDGRKKGMDTAMAEV